MVIEYVEDKNHKVEGWKGFIFAVAMFVTAIVQSFMLQYYFHYCYLLGMKVKTALLGLIYEKVIKKTRHTYRYFQLSEKKPSKVNSKPKTRLLRHLKIRRIDVMLLLQSLASFYSRIKSYTSMSWKVKKETT